MDLERAFPDFDEARIVHRESGLLVVDKPAGVPSQAADPEVHDDLPSRLARFAPYLGTHQRLDAETSGLVLFTTERSANAAIAEQFEKRRVKKSYLACVQNFRARESRGAKRSETRDRGARGAQPLEREGTLTDLIDGKRAVLHYRVIERRGERALVAIDLETGRTHQARIQLARAGSPIAGDTMYGGPAAPRLMLHAAALEVSSPSGPSSDPNLRRLRLRAPEPREMREWLERGDRGPRVYEDDRALRNALAIAFERRWGLLRAMPAARATSVFRLANEEGDALPGLAVDFYGGFAVATFYGGEEHRARVLDALASFGFDGVYEKSRPKNARATPAEREALAPRAPSRGSAAPSPFVVHEEGLPYLVRLDDGLATGFYADQRRNRVRVRAASAGKRVLNLFAYTCAFSVAASAGGAARVVSVDASASFLERGRENVRHAGFDLGAQEFVAADARAYLERVLRKNERFDLVILDPPSFGTAGGRHFSIASDFVSLAALAMRALAPGGQMLASINHRKTPQDRFRHAVVRAAREAGLAATVRDLPPPLDYPQPALKAVWARV